MLPGIEPLRMSAGSFNIINQEKYQQALDLLREAVFDRGCHDARGRQHHHLETAI